MGRERNRQDRELCGQKNRQGWWRGREGNVKMSPSFLDRYLRGGTSEENRVVAVAGDMMGLEGEVAHILRHPGDVSCAVFCTCLMLRREVWPRDTNLGVICLEVPLVPVMKL